MTPAGPAPAIDVNAELHPYPVVQHWLNQTTDYCLYAVPDEAFTEEASLTPEKPEDFFGINGGYGIHFRSTLHGFDSSPQTGTLLLNQTVSESLGSIQCLCLFGPDDLRWAPDAEPEPRIYDPYRPRRFTIQEITFRLGDEMCRGYGVGRTQPEFTERGQVTMAGGTGNITFGDGRFAGLEGTFVMTGVLTPDFGFRGQITLRMIDPRSRLTSNRPAHSVGSACAATDGSAFYVMRGEKKDRTVRTTFGAPRGSDQSLITPSQMRWVEFSCEGRRGMVETFLQTQSVAAAMNATVYFNLLAPPGIATAPVPFSTEEVYTFTRPNGPPRDIIYAEVRDGICFKLTFPDAPDQPAVRFAGFGPITGGTGMFDGVRGMLTVNSLIGISPHALSLVHVLHVLDPEGKNIAPRSRRGCA